MQVNFSEWIQYFLLQRNASWQFFIVTPRVFKTLMFMLVGTEALEGINNTNLTLIRRVVTDSGVLNCH